jgi:hypothetical protein
MEVFLAVAKEGGFFTRRLLYRTQSAVSQAIRNWNEIGEALFIAPPETASHRRRARLAGVCRAADQLGKCSRSAAELRELDWQTRGGRE